MAISTSLYPFLIGITCSLNCHRRMREPELVISNQ